MTQLHFDKVTFDHYKLMCDTVCEELDLKCPDNESPANVRDAIVKIKNRNKAFNRFVLILEEEIGYVKEKKC